MRISGQSILATVQPGRVAAAARTRSPSRVSIPAAPKVRSATTIPNLLIDHAMRNPHIPPGFWRGVNNNQNAIYLECFMDELAHAGGPGPARIPAQADGKHPKHLAVLNAVAEKAGWGKPAPQGVFRGICQHMGYGSYVAACAEVSVNGNEVKIHRIVAATDPRPRGQSGSRSNAQIPGSFVYGLSALFYRRMHRQGRPHRAGRTSTATTR